MSENQEYHIYNDNKVGFSFSEDWKSFLAGLSLNLEFIEDEDYNFKYSTEGKIGISLENSFIHIWFEEEKFDTERSKEIVQEFCNTLCIRYGNIIKYR